MNNVITTVLSLPELPPSRAEIQRALAVELGPDGGNGSFDFYAGTVPGGSWVDRVDFRERVGGGKKFLVLYASPERSVAVDLDALVNAHGVQPELDVNPHVQPSGSYAYKFGSSGKRIIYSFDQATKTLRSVSIAWE
jgi:hypothetical protein